MFYTSFTSRLFYCSTPHLSLDYFTVLHLLYLQTILLFYTSFTSRLFYCSTAPLSLDYFTVIHLLYLYTILLFYTSFISRLFYCYTPPLSLDYFTVLHLLYIQTILLFFTSFISTLFYFFTPSYLKRIHVLHLLYLLSILLFYTSFTSHISLKTILLFSTSNIAGQFYCTTIITLKSLYYFTPGFACPPPFPPSISLHHWVQPLSQLCKPLGLDLLPFPEIALYTPTLIRTGDRNRITQYQSLQQLHIQTQTNFTIIQHRQTLQSDNIDKPHTKTTQTTLQLYNTDKL